MKRDGGDKSESSPKAQKLDDASSSDEPCKAEDKVAAVEVRYLSGDTEFINGCSTVLDVMVHVSMRKGRFASEVTVTETHSGEILNPMVASPSLVSVILREVDEYPRSDELMRNLYLHATREDLATCMRIVSMLRERGLQDMLMESRWPWEPYIYETPLMAAARSGYTDLVAALLAARSNPRVRIHALNETPLIAAVANRHENVVKLLLEKGAVVNAKGCCQSPLGRASEIGDVNMAKLLLAAGACVNLKGGNDRTPLMMAAYHGHICVVETLLSAGAKLNKVCRTLWARKEETALDTAALGLGHNWLEMMEVLRAAGARRYSECSESETSSEEGSGTGEK